MALVGSALLASLVALFGSALLASQTTPSELEEGWPYGYGGYQ
jgi:hypothetical protein